MKNLFALVIGLIALFTFGASVSAQSTTYNCDGQPGPLQSECEALVDLYQSTDGDNWTDNTNWMTDASVCDRYGVKCNRQNKQVRVLKLAKNNLVWSIPESLVELTDLRVILLQKNTLCGEFPQQLLALPRLRKVNVRKNNLIIEETVQILLFEINWWVFLRDNQNPQYCGPTELAELALKVNEQHNASFLNYQYGIYDLNDNAINPVLTVGVPEGLCTIFEFAYPYNGLELSFDHRQTWEIYSFGEFGSQYCGITDYRVVYPLEDDQYQWAWAFLSFYSDGTPQEDYCIDIVYSADNAQYAEYTSCVEGALTYCGDRVLSGGEQCDDGNSVSGDGCSEVCESEVATEVSVEGINLTDVDVPLGSQNVDIIKFQVENDGDTTIEVEELTFEGIENFDEDYIDALRLWQRTDLGFELLEEQSGFNIIDMTISFDDFDEISVIGDDTQEFLLTVDITDDAEVVGDTIEVELTGIDAEDDNGNTVAVEGLPTNSDRQVTIVDFGSLMIEVDNTDALTDDSEYVVAGSLLNEVPYVASFEFTVDNEPVEIEDLDVLVYGDESWFAQGASEVILFDEDQNVIASEVVTQGWVVSFDNIDLFVDEWRSNIYVKVVGDLMGDNQNGMLTQDVRFALEVGDVEGADSGEEIVVEYDNGDETATSNAFAIVPVSFVEVEFVQSAAGFTVDTEVSPGTDTVIAILKLTASEWDNTDAVDGSDLDIILNSLVFETSNTQDITNYELRRVWNGSTDYYLGNQFGDQVSFYFDTGSIDYTTREIESMEIAYFVVRADISPVASDSFVRLELEIDGGISYSSSDYIFSSNELRIWEELTESYTITISNN